MRNRDLDRRLAKLETRPATATPRYVALVPPRSESMQAWMEQYAWLTIDVKAEGMKN